MSLPAIDHGVFRRAAHPFAPILPEFLSRGYALAQSRYRTQGWAVKEGIEDIEALRVHIMRRYGRPREMYIAGVSMGGLISVATVELHPRVYDGALVLCGAVMPATQLLRERMWDMILSFDFLFPGVLGDDPGHMARVTWPRECD